MLTGDVLDQVEVDAERLIAMAGGHPGRPQTTSRMARTLLGAWPRRTTQLRCEGALCEDEGHFSIWVHASVSRIRRSWVVGHELAHWFYRTVRPVAAPHHVIEEMCDTLGAALVLPKPFVRELVEHSSNSCNVVAEEAATTQSVAMLRIGEVARSPTVLLRRGKAPVVRGGRWGTGRTLAARPVAISDEPRKLGWATW